MYTVPLDGIHPPTFLHVGFVRPKRVIKKQALHNFCSFDTKLFQYKFFQSRCSSSHWLKEQRIFTQNVFLVYSQTILKVNKIFYAISLLGLVLK